MFMGIDPLILMQWGWEQMGIITDPLQAVLLQDCILCRYLVQ